MEDLPRKDYPPNSAPWTVTLWVSPYKRAAIGEIAARSGTSEAAVIERALDDWAEAMATTMRALRLKKGEGVGSFVLDEDYHE